MSFKDQINKDLNNVFFNEDEFSESATFTGSVGPMSILVYFDEKDDVVFDSGFDSDVSASVPSVTCKSSDVEYAQHGDEISVVGMTYYVIDMDPSVNGTRKLYLSEDRP